MQFHLPDGSSAVVVERRDSMSWALMPELLRRVREFCDKYDSEADARIVGEMIQAQFVKDTPGIVGMLHVVDGRATGHMLCSVGEWMGTRIATVLQLELGRSLDRSLSDAVLAWVNVWAYENGAKFVHCLVREEAAVRLFRQRYGFDREYASMRRPVIAPGVQVEGFELVNT